MKILARVLAVVFVAVGAATAVHAQSETAAAPPYSTAEGAFSEAELDQMLAPVALYPDELLSQILMAATYPLEVVEAARWSQANPGTIGADAVAAVDDRDWDPSVKSLVAFPDVLAMMNDRLEWTQRLGEAFLAQQGDVMLSVQKLRHAAYDEGNLQSSNEMVVTREGSDFALDSPYPETVYVPYYDPRVVYGDWWWPDMPPVYWEPWPGYYAAYGLWWGVGIPVSVNFFFGDFDWHHHHVTVHDSHPFYYHGRNHRPIPVQNNQWRFDPHHRHGVPYQNAIARRDFGGAGPGRGGNRPGTRPQGEQRGSLTARPQPGGSGQQARGFMPQPQRESNPVARPAPQQGQGFFPPAPPQSQARGQVEPRGHVQGGTRAPSPQAARPPAATPQAVQPQVHAQPLARPMNGPQVVHPVPQSAPQGAHPQGFAPHPSAPAGHPSAPPQSSGASNQPEAHGR